MQLPVHTRPVQPGFLDVDPRLRFSPAAYWRVFQDAAAEHARLLGAATEDLRRAGQTWMLSRMVLEVERPPLLGENLRVETWPSTQLRGVRAVRDFALFHESGERLASATSLWVIVDLATRRPQRIPDKIVALRHDPGYPVPTFSPELPSIAQPTHTRTFRAEWSDVDQNEHLNNVAYVRWAVDSLPVPFLEAHALRRVEVHYLAEIPLGASAEMRTSLADNRAEQELWLGDKLAARIALAA
ncbi:MAG: thioesterase [Bryobacter sp.]|nr:thioesterase [Bryobacter sp.]